jgi:hypothetical protein
MNSSARRGQIHSSTGEDLPELNQVAILDEKLRWGRGRWEWISNYHDSSNTSSNPLNRKRAALACFIASTVRRSEQGTISPVGGRGGGAKKKKRERRKIHEGNVNFQWCGKKKDPGRVYWLLGRWLTWKVGMLQEERGNLFGRDTVKRKLFPRFYSSFLLTMARGGIRAWTLPRLCTRKFLPL